MKAATGVREWKRKCVDEDERRKTLCEFEQWSFEISNTFDIHDGTQCSRKTWMRSVGI